MTVGTTPQGRKIFYRDELKFAFAATDAFVGTVTPGEVFEVETEININAGVLTSRLYTRLNQIQKKLLMA